MIAAMDALSPSAGSDLGELGLHLLAIPRQLGLHLWRVVHIAMPRENLLIGGHDRLFVVLDVLDSGLDVVRRETEETGNLNSSSAGSL